MNLLREPWIPVRCSDGRREWIAPARLSNPEIVAFDADRADFNGALAQFVIALLQTTTPVDSAEEWRALFEAPPDAGTLKKWFASVGEAFEFDGDGPRFMQDRTLNETEGAENSVGSLLIEAPGENALKNNSDLFIKRGQVEGLCLPCAASALFTLQTNAPAGGVGYRVGLRGGGPLTTLVLGEPPSTLWRDLWLNVRERSVFLAQGGKAANDALHYTFPWLADIDTIQRKGGELAPIQVHPAHVFWAMPRRIRFDLTALSPGECGICRRPSDRIVHRYAAKNYGLNYKGAWDHPLSPYYEVKGAWLPVHPQPGGIGYRHWIVWLCGLSSGGKTVRPARVVEHLLEHRRRQVRGQLRVWAFGYDMDNMKARCWHEATLPLYGLLGCGPDAQRRVESEVGVWLAGAEMAGYFLRAAVKDAWFSGEVRGDFSVIDAAFWSCTEVPFYCQLRDLIENARENRDLDQDSTPIRETWHQALIKTVQELFDAEFVGTGAIERQNPRRAALAFQRLGRNLRGPKIRQALGLPPLRPTSSGATRPST